MNKTEGTDCAMILEGPKVYEVGAGGGLQEANSSSTQQSMSHGQDYPTTEQAAFVGSKLPITGGVKTEGRHPDRN